MIFTKKPKKIIHSKNKLTIKDLSDKKNSQ